jgi:outer membrane autotransporter protein
MQATSLQQSRFTETSTVPSGQPGVWGLAVDSESGVSAPGSLGVQLDRAVAMRDGWTVSPVLRVAWVHDFATKRAVTASLRGLPGSPWTVDGAAGATDSASIGLSVQGMNRHGLAVFAALDSHVSGRTSSYQGQLGLKLVW